MKNSLIKISIRNFAKAVSIPPKLRNSTVDSRKNSSIFRYESLIDNKRDADLEKEKAHYNNIIQSYSKSMIFNHFKLNDSNNNGVFNEFYAFTSQKLDTKQINRIIQIIDEIKVKLESDDIEKTEELFKFLISKLYYLTEDKDKNPLIDLINKLEINEKIIELISQIPLKQISTKEIFKSKSEFELIEDGTDVSMREKNKKESAVALSMILNNYQTSIPLKNPEFSDIASPEVEFKDAMSQKLQSYDKNVYIFQKKSELTNFERSNFIFFNDLPLFFPVKSKATNKIIIKQLTNNLMLQNVLKMNRNQYYLNFNKAILEKSLSDFSGVKASIRNVFFKKDVEVKTSVNNMQMENFENESVDLILTSQEFEELDMKKIKTKKNTKSKKDTKSSKQNNPVKMDELIENTKFLDFKKIESDDILKKYANSFIYSNGFVITKDYKTKCDILKSSAGIFGFHILGRKNISLMDADFLHFLTIKNIGEENITFKDLIKRLNDELKLNNFSGPLLELPENKAHLDLNNEFFAPNSKVNIRFNGFRYFYEALQIFETKSSYLDMKCKILPTKNIYYDDNFICSYDFVLRNNYPNLKRPLLVDCDYLDKHDIQI